MLAHLLETFYLRMFLCSGELKEREIKTFVLSSKKLDRFCRFSLEKAIFKINLQKPFRDF